MAHLQMIKDLKGELVGRLLVIGTGKFCYKGGSSLLAMIIMITNSDAENWFDHLCSQPWVLSCWHAIHLNSQILSSFSLICC